MTFNIGDRVMVRPTVKNPYIPDPDHGSSILLAGTEVSWSPYWNAMLALGNILAVASGATTPISSPVLYTQAQLDAAVAAATASLQAQIAALQAQLAAGGSGPATPANDNSLSLSLDLASGSLLL